VPRIRGKARVEKEISQAVQQSVRGGELPKLSLECLARNGVPGERAPHGLNSVHRPASRPVDQRRPEYPRVG